MTMNDREANAWWQRKVETEQRDFLDRRPSFAPDPTDAADRMRSAANYFALDVLDMAAAEELLDAVSDGAYQLDRSVHAFWMWAACGLSVAMLGIVGWYSLPGVCG